MTKQEAIDSIKDKYGDDIYPDNHCCYGESESIANKIYSIIEQIDEE